MSCHIDADVLVRIRRSIELDPSAGSAWESSELLATSVAGAKPLAAVLRASTGVCDAIGLLPLPCETTHSALAAELMLLPRLAVALDALGRLRGDIDSGTIPGKIALRRAVHGLDKAIRAAAEANGWAGFVGPDFLDVIATRLDAVVTPRADLILAYAAAWRQDLDLPHHPRGDRLADLADERGVGPAEGIEPTHALEMLESEYERNRTLPAFGPSWPTVPDDLADAIAGHRQAIDGFLYEWGGAAFLNARKFTAEEFEAHIEAEAAKLARDMLVAAAADVVAPAAAGTTVEQMPIAEGVTDLDEGDWEVGKDGINYGQVCVDLQRANSPGAAKLVKRMARWSSADIYGVAEACCKPDIDNPKSAVQTAIHRANRALEMLGGDAARLHFRIKDDRVFKEVKWSDPM